ncbi:MAG TPA: type VI secretion system baseplate subunit TssF [Bryobacteraceae bacterium]
MTDEIYRYYEEELTFFRQMAGEFARKYPKVAARLQLEEAKESTDPHVERLIEAFALLCARVRHKIDDEFPEVVESLLNMLYPHYLRPVPSMAVAQFRFEPGQTNPSEPAEVPSGSLFTSRPSDALECTFRTAYPVTVWPLTVTGVALVSTAAVQAIGAPADAAWVLRIQLETLGNLPVSKLKIPKLRFFLNGDGTPYHLLYELLFVHAARIHLRPRAAPRVEPLVLPADRIRPVGFEPGEGLLEYSDRSFLGYRLLQEYFHFPQKFFFFDLDGLDAQPLDALGTSFEILIFFRDSELRDRMPSVAQAVTADTLQLGCTPVVNLFEKSAEPIRVSHAVTEYQLIPDRHRQASMEVYSVGRVTSAATYDEEPRVYEPFYSFRHSSDGESRCFWYAHRRPSPRKDDEGTEVYLSLVDLDFKPATPPVDLLTARVTCTNRDFVSRLEWRKEWGELQGEGLPLVQARCLVPPTKPARPPLRGSLQWRLISHLSLNRLSIVQGGGREALQEILRLYAFSGSEDVRKRIDGIAGLKSEASMSRVLFETGTAFCRGLDIEIEFDESQFAGSGVFLFSAVLERFFRLYSAVNSYSRLTARTRQRRNILKRWPPQIGAQRLL